MFKSAIGLLSTVLLSTAISGETNSPIVTVLFQKKTTLSAVQLQERAKAELTKKGVKDLDQYYCGINISFVPPNVGCHVLFSRGFGKPYHDVSFNHEGKIVAVQSGIMKEYIGIAPELDPEIRKEMERLGIDTTDPGKSARKQ